jgi:high-affinity iron transporter
MFPGFLLSLREGLEAALIVGIVLAALRKVDRSSLSSAVWYGVAAALVFSIIAGLTLNWLGAEFEGRGEQIFEGTTMLIAAGLLTWMIIWMRRQSGNMTKELEHGVVKATAGQQNQGALFWLAFLAVGREGLELVLFLTAVEMATDTLQTVWGTVFGLITAIGLGWVIFSSSKRMNLRLFFNVTNILLVLFAAGLLAHGVHEFNEAGIIPSVLEHVWDINPILNEDGTVGQLLTALFGYNGNPALTETIAYFAYFAAAWLLWNKVAPAQPAQVRRPVF